MLRKKCECVSQALLQDPKFKAFLKDMVTTMHREEGVGLAANQVGRDLSAIVLECCSSRRYPQADDFKLETYVNPRILEYSSDKETDWEGCLSIPGYRGLVPRSRSIVFEGTTPDGETVRKKVEGFQARVFQHEVDHINGFFYVDRMTDLKTWMHLDEFKRLSSDR